MGDQFQSKIKSLKKTRVRFTEDLPLTASVAEAIGHAVVEWGRTEDTASVLTAVLLGTNYDDFRAVAANMMGHGKFDTLRAVAQLKLPKRKAATIEKIAESLRKLQAERNRIVHGCWYQTNNPDVARRHAWRAYESLDHKDEAVAAKRIAGHTSEVIQLCRRLNYALERHGIYRREPRS